MKSMENYSLDAKSVEHINKGRVYIGPRDKKGYITLMIFFDKEVELNEETAKEIAKTLEFVMCVLKKYCMLPYYSELFNLFIDFDGMSLMNPKYQKPQGIITNHIQKHFKNELHQVYIINPSWASSQLLKLALKIFSTPRLNKVHSIKKADFKELFDYFEKKDLPEKYGGLKKIESYWSPFITEEDTLEIGEIKSKNIQVFTVLMSEQKDRELFPDETHENRFNSSMSSIHNNYSDKNIIELYPERRQT